MFLWWSCTKIVQAILIRQKAWPPGGRGLFSLYICIENFKNLLVRNHWTDFHIILQKCFFGDPLARLFKPFGFVKKHGRRGVGVLIFPIYLYRKFKKSSNQKPLERLQYNVAEMFLWWSCTKIVKAIWIRQKKHCRQGRGLFSLYIYTEKIEKSSCQKPLDRFHYYLAKMFPCWPSTKIIQVVVICQKTWPLERGAYFPYISI